MCIRDSHQIVVLGAGPRDPDRVAFLKGVRADQMRGHLPGDAHERDRIEQRVGDAGDGVGRARPRGDEHDAGLAGRARIALCRVGRGLFVANEDMLDRGMIAVSYPHLDVYKRQAKARSRR